MASGIAEFATLTVAAVIAMRRTRGQATLEARVYAGVVKVLAVGYPLLGLVYLTDRLGTLVEPVFFVAFSVMLLAVIFEPAGRQTTPSWAERVAARGIESQASGQEEPAAGGPAESPVWPVSPMVAVPTTLLTRRLVGRHPRHGHQVLVWRRQAWCPRNFNGARPFRLG